MSTTSLALASFILGALAANNVFADADAEREALAAVLHELQTLEALIVKAEAQRQQDARVQFRYDWLRQDLERIQLGIQSHIDAPRSQPRVYPPLRGDYRR
jgi:RAQPRD family integrative conjugative element protein